MARRLEVILAFCLTAFAAAAPLPCRAWDLAASVVDAAGRPLADAVIVLKPVTAIALPPLDPATRAAVGQQDKAFVPRVLAVRTGTVVSFPNRDPILHHVYSFSPTKSFELELYGAREIPELVFDQAGVVLLACNIHDGMRGHVYVTDSPWFGVSGADGAVAINALPAVTFTVEVWHERQVAQSTASVSVSATTPAARLIVDVRPQPVFELAPHESGEY